VNTFVRLMPVLFACVATQVIAGDPPTPKAVDPDRPTAQAPATATDTASQATPSPTKTASEEAATTPAQPQKVVLNDKSVTNEEVRQLLAQGYKPQKGRGDDVLYCRSEQPIGTRFPKKVCKSADQLKAQTQDSRDLTEMKQRASSQAPGH
jgi:hypothetical protein